MSQIFAVAARWLPLLAENCDIFHWYNAVVLSSSFTIHTMLSTTAKTRTDLYTCSMRRKCEHLSRRLLLFHPCNQLKICWTKIPIVPSTSPSKNLFSIMLQKSWVESRLTCCMLWKLMTPFGLGSLSWVSDKICRVQKTLSCLDQQNPGHCGQYMDLLRVHCMICICQQFMTEYRASPMSDSEFRGVWNLPNFWRSVSTCYNTLLHRLWWT